MELVLQRAVEKYPKAKPRIFSDNGQQFVARDFKAYIRQLGGVDHVRTSPYYPQSNGKIERVNQTVKAECIRVKAPLSLAQARQATCEFVEYYNCRRLHSAIGYIAPMDRRDGSGFDTIASYTHCLINQRNQDHERRKAKRRETAGTAGQDGH